MGFLTKEELLSKPKLARESVNLDGIGEVMIYEMTARQKDEYENSILRFRGRSTEVNLSNARAKLAVICVRDEQGNPLFTEADIGRIGQMPVSAIEPIVDTARRLSGMSADEIERIVKNSEAVQSEDSNGD